MRILLSFIADNKVLLFFFMLLLLVVLVLVIVLLLVVLLFMLLLLVYYEQKSIACSNGVLGVDQGKLDTELPFSCNIRSTTKSIDDYIYSTPVIQAKDSGSF